MSDSAADPAAPRRSRSKLVAALLLLLVAGSLGWYVLHAEPTRPSFVTAVATVGDIDDTVLATGVLQPFRQVSVGAQVTGQVKSLKVVLGERVVAGQLIAEIDSVPQRNALGTAEAALSNVMAQLRAQRATQLQTRQALGRQREMRAADASSAADLEAALAADELALATIDGLQAQIRQATITVDTARQNLGYTRIAAPISGMVVAVATQQGQTVNSLQSAPTIVRIAQVDTMTVKTQISEADITGVLVGQTVRFTILGEPDRPYVATLRAVEPAPEAGQGEGPAGGAASNGAQGVAVYYNGLFDVPNPDGRLRIAMTAQVQIVRNTARGAVVIPTAALGPRTEGRVEVRRLDQDGIASPVSVTLGIRNAVAAQVLSGLAAGDVVVVGEAAGSPGQARRDERSPGR